MILLIDNYDSFSYNLYQLLGEFDKDIEVYRNDAISLKEIERLSPSLIVLSPGPGKPENAGICIDAIRYFRGKIPIFGVCLGHQAITIAYGGKVGYAKRLMHGKTSKVYYNAESHLFKNLSNPFIAGRYHSLASESDTLPKSLIATAKTADDEIMALRARNEKVYGVQFHPESILTPDGKKIIENLMEDIRK